MSENLLDGLKKYVVEGSIQEELKREQQQGINESGGYSPKNDSDKTEYNPPQGGTGEVYPVYQSSRRLIESVLREFQMAMDNASIEMTAEMPQEDSRIKSSQALVRLVQDNLWKLQDSTRVDANKEVDDDIKELIAASVEPIIKASIKKLHQIWCTSEEPKQEPEPTPATPVAPEGVVQVVVGESITSPKGIVYTVTGINGEKVMLEDAANKSTTVEKSIAIKWKK